MSRRPNLRRWLFRNTGVYVNRFLPHGADLFEDIHRSLRTFTGGVFLDVGANTGQTADMLLREFPQARVHSFEPVEHTFRQLQNRFAGDKRVTCHRLAFGATSGEGVMLLEGTSDMYRLRHGDAGSAAGTGAQETVPVDTLDRWCTAVGLEAVDLLKVDTEGGDLDVLKGASRMLAEQRIGLVEVETGMNPGNTFHVPFQDVVAFMSSKDMLLFGIYDQVQEWTTGSPHLRRSNAVFISRRSSEANRSGN